MMSRLLLQSHCFSRTDLLRNSVPKFHVCIKSIAEDLKRKSCRGSIRFFKNNTNKCKSQFKFKSSLIIGGCTIGIIAERRFIVNCQSSPLVGVLTNDTRNRDEDIKFDWKKLWYYLKPYTWEFVAAVFAALAVAFFNIKIPSLLGDLINILAKYANIFIRDTHSTTFFKDVKRPALSLFIMYILQSGFTFLYILLLSRVGEKMAAKIRQDLFQQIILQDIEFFDKHRTGKLVNRLTADVQDFKSSFKQVVSQGLRSVAQLIGGAISLIIISPHMAGIALASVPAIVAFMNFLGRTLRKLSKKAQAQSEHATAICDEAITNIRTVRSSSAEYREIELFTQETEHAAFLAEQLGYGIAIFQALTNFFLNGLVLSTLFLGGHLMSTETLSPGQLMAFLVASQNVQRSLSQGSILLGTMIRGLSAGSRVFDYLAIQPKVGLMNGVTIPKDLLKGKIQFENVTFAYPTRVQQEVLKDFNLTLNPGETIALVGASGSGKSTVAALLERFYEPKSGDIKLDGYNLQSIQPYWLHSNVIGFIEQEPVLFATTILENIRYGRPDATMDEVIQVAKLSQAHDFITELPNSYETNVGERGSQLSGGQKQRIAIARALLKKPIILILDEATSALDAASEAIVQKALDVAVTNKTTLVIAHRLSTIKNADLIVVLNKGQIIEVGKHEELLAKKGFYYELVRQQEEKEQTTEKEIKLENDVKN